MYFYSIVENILLSDFMKMNSIRTLDFIIITKIIMYEHVTEPLKNVLQRGLDINKSGPLLYVKVFAF